MTPKRRQTEMSGVLEIPGECKEADDTSKMHRAVNLEDTTIDSVIPEYTEAIVTDRGDVNDTAVNIKAINTESRQEAKVLVPLGEVDEPDREWIPPTLDQKNPWADAPLDPLYLMDLEESEEDLEATQEFLREDSSQAKTYGPLLVPVILETPYSGDIEVNESYARQCMRDCLARGEAPFASHMLYTQPGVLRDDVPLERELVIRAGFAWRELAEYTVVYTDMGISRGMRQGIDNARVKNLKVIFRRLNNYRHEFKSQPTPTGLTKISQSDLELPALIPVTRRQKCLLFWKVLTARARRLLAWAWPGRSASEPTNESSSQPNQPKDP